jgi:hypothetical protein
MDINIIPDSIRVDAVNTRILESKSGSFYQRVPKNYLTSNPIWKRTRGSVQLTGAGNETIAFQIIVGFKKQYRDFTIDIGPLKAAKREAITNIEIFKEWYVEIRKPSYTYKKSSLAPGWFPDALVPYQGSSFYSPPYLLPDPRNRLPNQRSAAFWVDIYIPTNQKHGSYTSSIIIKADPGINRRIPIKLDIYPFNLPNHSNLICNVFSSAIKAIPEEKELKYQQEFKKHRLFIEPCYYRPELTIKKNQPILNWKKYDNRLAKYLDGSAFTSKYGYSGPGYGLPIESLILPFNCSGGKKSISTWPLPATSDMTGKTKDVWEKTIKIVMNHLFRQKRVSTKTKAHIFLLSLDELYDEHGQNEMVWWADYFKKHMPGIPFRVDGGFNRNQMKRLSPLVDLWANHTADFNFGTVRSSRLHGVEDWIYGPMLYESRAAGCYGSSSLIDLDLLSMRSMGWVCFKYGISGWTQWEFSFENKKAWYNPENIVHNNPNNLTNGASLFVYDEEHQYLQQPCVNILLKAARTGIQEYEYLHLLRQLGGKPEKYNDQIIFEPLGPKSYGNIKPWNTNIADWDKIKKSLGNEIIRRI